MAVHLKPEETRGYHSPESLGLVYCSAERVEIAGTELLKSGDEELCLVCIAGKAFYQCGGESGEAVLCDMLYAPVRSYMGRQKTEPCGTSGILSTRNSARAVS